MRKIIKSTDGHILTNGEVFGRTIYLAEGETGEDFYEITEEEYDALTSSLEDIIEIRGELNE